MYGVSVDSAESHRRFIAEEHLNFPLLVDADKGFVRYLDLLGANGLPKRVTIVIDKQGIVRKIDRSVNVLSHGADLVQLLKGM